MSNSSQTLRNLRLYMRNTRVTTPGEDGDQRGRTRCGQCGAEVLDGQMAQHTRRHNITAELKDEEDEAQAVRAVRAGRVEAQRRPGSRLEAMRAKRQRRA